MTAQGKGPEPRALARSPEMRPPHTIVEAGRRHGSTNRISADGDPKKGRLFEPAPFYWMLRRRMPRAAASPDPQTPPPVAPGQQPYEEGAGASRPSSPLLLDTALLLFP